MSNNNPFPADLNINTWTEPGCDKATGVKTTVSLNNSLAYSMMWSIGRPVQSYMLNRTLQSWERLDWSSPYANDATPEGGAIPEGCGNYLQTTNPDSNGHMLQGGICYPIIDGATVCVLDGKENDHIVKTNILNVVCEHMEYELCAGL